MSIDPSLLVVIPTFNCEKQIVRLIAKYSSIIELRGIETWIIDNGSSDFTLDAATRAKQENKMSNIKIFQTKQNNSLGGTIKIAFNSAVENGYDYVAILHGDDQAECHDLLGIWEMVKKGGRNCSILGTRFDSKSKLIGYSFKRIAGNKVLNMIYSAFLRKKLSDLGSGLNLYRVEDLKKVDYMFLSNSLFFNYQLMIHFAKQKMPFSFYPIIWKELDQKSNAQNFKIFLWALGVLFIPRLRLSRSANKEIYELKHVA